MPSRANPSRTTSIGRTLALCLLGLVAAVAAAGPPSAVTMTLDPVAYGDPDRTPFTGRLYLCFTPVNADLGASSGAGAPTPMERMHSWFDTVPLAAWDVVDVVPGEPVTLTGMNLLHMHDRYRDQWGRGVWHAQAVARRNADSPKAGRGEGDLYSAVVTVDMDQDDPAVVVELTNRVGGQAFEETDRIKHVRLRSEQLSAFHGRDVFLDAAVALPASWGERDEDGQLRRYPIVYVVTGFGGSHHQITRYVQMLGGEGNIGEAIVVVPDASNYWGHSVFANSAVTGPWGDALVYELAPAIEAIYRGPTDPSRRFVTGVSSGGWSSLWLQVEYPDQFGGCWAHVPDPVDFRAFQTVNIYTDNANFFTGDATNPANPDDPGATRRPIARRGGDVMIYADDFIGRETVLGPGGQIESFEGVFSPRAPDGTPVRLFDRETGAIHPATAEAWQPYDITLKMRAEWAANRDMLAGKIRVYGGAIDNFYLGESVGLLRESLLEMGVRLGSMDEPPATGTPEPDADVRVIEGLEHRPYMPGVRAMWRAIHGGE